MKVSEMWPQIETEIWCSKCGKLDAPLPTTIDSWTHLCGGRITIKERSKREPERPAEVDWTALWWAFVIALGALMTVITLCDLSNTAHGETARTLPRWLQISAGLSFIVIWTDVLYRWSKRR